MSTDAYAKAQELRHEYRSCIKLANETDSKKEDAYLRNEAKKVLEELKTICPHKDIVILNSNYSGSYIDDYDDRSPERRKCLFCTVEESHYCSQSYLTTDSQFKILKDENVRSRFEYNHPPQIKVPLDYLLSECQEVANTGYKLRK